jgi:hypothetical protein
MKHKCSGCGQRKTIYMPLQGGGYCRDCSNATGMSAPKNQAVANSKAWQKKACTHQSRANSFYKRHHTEYYREICRRCGVTVVNVIAGHHNRRGR